MRGKHLASVKPYFHTAGLTIYNADARRLIPKLDSQPKTVITDPVWPNNVFPNVEDPKRLLTEVLGLLHDVDRVVIQLGCDSDVRFLSDVPDRWPYFRTCWLDYACPSYKGRVLYTGDVAYVFGQAPPSKPGAHVLPGRHVSTKSDRLFHRENGRNKSTTRDKTDALLHPSPRRLQHVRWLVKWFAGKSVIDPFMGSGTTLLACKEMGIPTVGIEIEERFCELAVKRIESQDVLGLTEATAV